ncbi:hypothetical protein DFH09DRAFT_1088941 [Mycena vulgaris]|nr:hypothetical protein DFH09DRAFT_1088941 [Mycena vulgaris]
MPLFAQSKSGMPLWHKLSNMERDCDRFCSSSSFLYPLRQDEAEAWPGRWPGRRGTKSKPPRPQRSALESGGVTEESIPSVEPGAACKLFFFISATLLFAAYMHTFQRDLVSPSKPFLENVGACLMFGVRGLEILFILGLVIRLGMWVRDICVPHVGEGIELEPEPEAQSMKAEKECEAAVRYTFPFHSLDAAAAEEGVPPQPVLCIGIDAGANIPYTAEKAKEAGEGSCEA